MVEFAMGLNIKNPALEAEIRELAAIAGESLTEAIAKAVRERRERLGKPKLTPEEKLSRLREIQASLRDFPAEYRTSNHDDLYDEHGLPR
jgi:antitoxin VapB